MHPTLIHDTLHFADLLQQTLELATRYLTTIDTRPPATPFMPNKPLALPNDIPVAIQSNGVLQYPKGAAMKTDLPLKRVTQLCPADLLSLVYGSTQKVVAVETLELPPTTTSLDTLIRLQHPDGYEYLHLIEWQGYYDAHFLWRMLGYLSWLGQNRAERPILATVIYLTPKDVPKDDLNQQVTGTLGWSVDIPSIRLWELDAYAALASNAPGLIALAPLMHGADANLVAAAAQAIMQRTEQPTRGELLTALGTFAEPLMTSTRFLRLVRKEQLMANGLIATLFHDEIKAAVEAERQALVQQMVQQKDELVQQKDELVQQKDELVQQKDELVQQKDELVQQKDELVQQKDELVQQKDELVQSLQQALHQMLVLRYPTTPATFFERIAHVSEAHHLQRLLDAILTAPDLDGIQQVLDAVAPHT